MKTKQEIEEALDRLLHSGKPCIIAGRFDDVSKLSEKEDKHFKTAEYLWNLKVHDKDDDYKGMHMGVLLDENLNYVHIVFGSIEFINQISDNKKLIT